MSDPFGDLTALEAHLWQRMATGVTDADDPFRTVAFATSGARGAEARMVGLRAADRERGTVEVHSDLRTSKVEALRHDPRAELLFWDPKAQLQVRVSVTVSILPADPDRWARIPDMPRLNYGTDPAPGTPVPAPDVVTRTPDVERFVALLGSVMRMDAVSLSHAPHRRAVFEGRLGRWVAP